MSGNTNYHLIRRLHSDQLMQVQYFRFRARIYRAISRSTTPTPVTMDIAGFPVLSVQHANLLIFDEDEPDFIGWEASGLNMKRKVLGYFKPGDNQPSGGLRSAKFTMEPNLSH